MNEVQTFDNHSQAVERTKQFYCILHKDIRVKLVDTISTIDVVYAKLAKLKDSRPQFTAQTVADAPPPEPVAIPKINSRELKTIYFKICNLCHPDKTGLDDSTLVRFLGEAKEAYRERDLPGIKLLYDQVLLYKENPVAYKRIHDTVCTQLSERDDPWFTVHKHHSLGDQRQAFNLSQNLLNSNLAYHENLLDQMYFELSVLESDNAADE